MAEEPAVVVVPLSAQRARRFLRVVGLTLLGVGAGIVGASIYSNHYGYFGSSGQLQGYNDRLGKVSHLQSLPKDGLPNVYLLGSSDMLPFIPEKVDSLFGGRAFNLGVFWGRTEEIWAWTNFLFDDLGALPRMVIIGVESWTFSDSGDGPPLLPEYRRRTMTVPELAQYLPEFRQWKYDLSRVLDSFSGQSMWNMLVASSRNKLRRRPQPTFASAGYGENGTWTPYTNRTPEPWLSEDVNVFYEEHTDPETPLSPGAARQRAEFFEEGQVRLDRVHAFLPGDRMNSDDLMVFERTIALLDSRGVEIGLVLLPVHPLLYDLLTEYTRHQEHLTRIRALFQRLEQRYPSVRASIDASHISRFGGRPGAFIDPMHMTPDNADLVIEKLREAWDPGE